jgi:glycerol-3-phosphate acyltransferase PlsY
MTLGIVLLLTAFLLGSVPTGYLIAKVFFQLDIRDHGSGNIGATNVGRTLGRNAGLYTLIGDLAKGMVGASLGFLIDWPASAKPNPLLLTGLCAICGHCFSPFLRFKGGKGVATAGGVILIALPAVAPGLLLTFVAIFKLSKFVSLASIITAASLVPWTLATTFLIPMNYDGVSLMIAATVSLVVILRHHANIGRLMRGEEPRTKKSSG